MKKRLLSVLYFIQWIIYFVATLEARYYYNQAEEAWLWEIRMWLYGNGPIQWIKPPVRNFVRWAEFWDARGYGWKHRK